MVESPSYSLKMFTKEILEIGLLLEMLYYLRIKLECRVKNDRFDNIEEKYTSIQLLIRKSCGCFFFLDNKLQKNSEIYTLPP